MTNKRNKKIDIKKLKDIDLNIDIDEAFDRIKEDRVPPKMNDNGTVKQYSTETLTRPKFKFKENKSAMIIVGVAAIAAFLIIFVSQTVSVGSNILNSKSIDTNLQRNIDYQIPAAASFLETSKEEAENILIANQMSFVSITSENDTSNSYDIFKVPLDCDAAWAKERLNKGFNKMGVVDASKLLNGGWQLTADKQNTNHARIRYADFTSVNTKEAVQKGFSSQHFEDYYQTNDDVDELGNTYIAGTAKYNDRTISWRVSAIAIKEVYDIGLPETGIYVGIRVEYV